MRRTLRTIVTGASLACLALPPAVRAQEQAAEQPPAQAQAQEQDQDLQKTVEALKKEVDGLKQQAKRTQEKSLSSWLTVGGDYRFRLDSLHGEVADYIQFNPADPAASGPVAGYDVDNDTLMTNRFGLDLKVKAARNVTVTTRLLMYKTSGNATADATNAGFFADRFFLMDGSIGHVPSDNTLRVDQVFATWSNMFELPMWFSVGRRPSTGGSPLHLRQNGLRPGNGGVPGLLVDYAFDGMTLGVAPEIDALPGMYAKLCYGRGFEAGYDARNGLDDTDMVGIQVVPYDTDPFRIDFQWNRGMNIFDNPNQPTVQLGDIDWYGVNVLSTLKDVGPGLLNAFASGGVSVAKPNGNVMMPGAGLMGDGQGDETGYAVYAGFRYDLPSGTKIGGEYNWGSEFWIPFDPASDDVWTAKLGTRGNVYEAYLIQELPLKPISSFVSKAFFKVGYQLYDFNYTGSNNWIGAPVEISQLMASPMNAQMLPPVEKAQNIYGTFEVKF